jgi:cold shock protein
VIEASVREWHDELGWGVLDSIDTPGGCWVHFSHIDTAGYRSLTGLATVLLDYELARQDGYDYCARRVRVPSREPAGDADQRERDAYRSRHGIELDGDL